MATHLPVIGGHAEGFCKTARTDNWKGGPAITFLVFSLFVVYTTWAAFQGNHYFVDPYLSPFYSPVVHAQDLGPGVSDAVYASRGMVPPSHAWLGTFPSWWPGFIPMSPALLILMFPGGFRFTCYYYRKAYYRSFAGSPPGCAVGPLGGKRRYNGETRLLLIQNLHRFFLYAALAFIFLLGKDAVEAFFRHGKFGIGVGSLIITINVFLIAAYTFGCHSFRHLIGGRKDFMCSSSGSRSLTHKGWSFATWFNERHMQFAWASLLWVMITDLYIRLLSMGVIKDLNTW
jgi:hypothetical protein